MTQHNPDLGTREDITRFVDRFYTRVRADGVLGPIFDDIAQVDWTTHLPRMYDFWESVLFGKALFKGDPLTVHQTVGALIPLTPDIFDRWIALFHATVDELFEGAMADETKVRALRIADVLQHFLEHGRPPNPRPDSSAKVGLFVRPRQGIAHSDHRELQ